MSKPVNSASSSGGPVGVGVPAGFKFDHLVDPSAGRSVGSRVQDVLQVRPNGGKVSETGVSAIRGISADARVKGGEEKARKLIQQEGLSTHVASVTRRLSGMALDETTRLLLATPDAYGTLLAELISKKVVAPTDVVGMADAVLREMDAEDGLRARYIDHVVASVRKSNAIQIDDADAKAVGVRLRTMSLPTSSPGLDSIVIEEFRRTLKDGNFPTLIEEYAKRKELDPERLTPQIRASMATFLRERGVNTSRPNIVALIRDGKYDEYFALAFDAAIRSTEGSSDPLTAARTGVVNSEWDFTVDTFDTIEAQGVVRANILAAGALDYNFELGERLGIFRLADAIVLNWAAGAIDTVGADSKLYRYHKLSEERFSVEERGMMYKRVLNKGDAEVLSRTVVNETFTNQWDKLMFEAAKFIEKTEESRAESMDESKVSRTPIYEVTRLLQYNLTEFCTGMAHVHARETYAALQSAIELLSDPEIAAHFGGGRRGSLWTTIERLSRAEFGEVPPIAALRSMAVDGNRIFRWIADFQRGAVDEDRFREFLEAAEAYVLSKASVDGAGLDEPSEDDGSMDDSGNDEFADIER